METNQNNPATPTNERNNNGTIGQETETEKGNDPRFRHTPNPHGIAENEEDHRVKGPSDEEEPRDTVSS